MTYAVRLYNKEENNLIQVVNAKSKIEARRKVRIMVGSEYKLGQAYKTDRDPGLYEVDVNTYSTVRGAYTESEIHNLKKSLDELRQQQADKKEQEWERKHPDGETWDKVMTGLPTRLGWKKIEPGSKYDRVHFDQQGRRITRKRWKKIRRLMKMYQT